MTRGGAAVLAVVLLAGCSGSGASPSPPVSQEEASTALAELVSLADARDQAAVRTICDRHPCTGLSSGEIYALPRHPGPDRPPRELCSVQLPALDVQLGARLLVVEGVDASDRPYVSQLLVERLDDRVVVQEPAYWLGVRYTRLSEGRSTYSGMSDEPAARARHLVQARQPCEDPKAFLEQVAGA